MTQQKKKYTDIGHFLIRDKTNNSADIGYSFTKNNRPFCYKTTLNKACIPMAHAASLCETADGMVAIWYGGTEECFSDVKIYFSRQQSEYVWSSPKIIMTVDRVSFDLSRPIKSLGNAILMYDKSGDLILLFSSIAVGRWSGSQLNISISHDKGISWSHIQRLTLSPFFNLSDLIRNHPIPMIEGGWIIPAYQEFLGKFAEIIRLNIENNRVIYFKERITSGCKVFQPDMIPFTANNAIIFLRDATKNKILQFTLFPDFHRPLRNTHLSNPDSAISATMISNKSLLLIFNNSKNDRSNLALTIAKFSDNLLTNYLSWSKIIFLEKDIQHSFAYPYIISSNDGTLHLVYTLDHHKIEYMHFNRPWLNFLYF